MKRSLTITAAALLGSSMLVGSGLAQSVDADVGVDDGIGAEVGADVGADSDVDVGADTDAGTAFADEPEGEVDATVTGAIGVTDEDRAFFGQFGTTADAFFTDETRTELRSEAELQAQFAAMTPEEQEALRNECALISADGVEGTAAAQFCLAIEAI